MKVESPHHDLPIYMAVLYLETNYPISEESKLGETIILLSVMFSLFFVAFQMYNLKVKRLKREESVFFKIYQEIKETNPDFD